MKKLNIMKVIQKFKKQLFLSSFVMLISCGGGIDKDKQEKVGDSLVNTDSPKKRY